MRVKCEITNDERRVLRSLERYAGTYFRYFDGKWDDISVVVKRGLVYIFCFRIGAADLVTWTSRAIPLNIEDLRKTCKQYKNKVNYAFRNRNKQGEGSPDNGVFTGEGGDFPGRESFRKVDTIPLTT